MSYDFSKHTLKLCMRSGDYSAYRLAVPGTRDGSCEVIFSPEGICILGDLVPCERGVISSREYNGWWLAGATNPAYLAEKFLTKRWVPELAAQAIEDWLTSGDESLLAQGRPFKRDEDGESELLGRIVDAPGELRYGERGEEWLLELCDDIEREIGVRVHDDGMPGWGYEPGEVELLSAIQKRFAELWRAGAGGKPARLIGIAGPAGSGKDTVAAMIAEVVPGAQLIAQADPLKRFCQEVFGWDRDRLWGPSERRAEADPDGLTPRRALQLLGTEWGRTMREDVWIDYAIRSADPNAAVTVITDVRFPNEARKIREAGGEVFLVVGRASVGVPEHESEAHWCNDELLRHVTSRIDNSMALDVTRAQVRKLLGASCE